MIQGNRFYWSHLKTKNVTVRVSPQKKQKGIVFRVCNMIDLGSGRQTVMLEHVDYPKTYGLRQNDKDVPVPFRMGSLDFVYTSGCKPAMRDVNNLLSSLYKDEQVEKIVPDVLTPGDLLVFTHEKDTMKIKLSQTLRVITDYTCKKSTANYAL